MTIQSKEKKSCYTHCAYCGPNLLSLTLNALKKTQSAPYLYKIIMLYIFAIKERDILITQKPGYILSQSMTPRIGEPAYATQLNVSYVSPIASSWTSYSALSSQLRISPPVEIFL